MSEGLFLSAIATVRIVLVSPAGPLNVGSVARVMKNFGLSQLVLVAPQCDPLGAEARQMAVHASDILEAAKQVKTIPDALAGCESAIATTARTRGFNAPLQLPEVALSTLVSDLSQAETALIFGPEDRGLSNQELTYAQAFLKIPTSDAYSALNLAQAVAICCYELYRASQPTGKSAVPSGQPTHPSHRHHPAQHQLPLQKPPSSAKQSESDSLNADLSRELSDISELSNRAKLNELEGYYQHLESLLLQVEYLYPHTAASRMRKLRQLLHRASPTSNEVALLRGILRQMEWALSDSNKG
ncbi:MAG: RNA methyltransferase [Cyanobacteria bacterium J06554_11]